MARYNNASCDCRNWTNAKLMSEARRLANLETFATGHFDGPEAHFKPGWPDQTKSPDVAEFCRNETRIYRDTYLTPILDEIERRFVKA